MSKYTLFQLMLLLLTILIYLFFGHDLFALWMTGFMSGLLVVLLVRDIFDGQ